MEEEETEQLEPDYVKRKESIPADFFHWLQEASKIVNSKFTGLDGSSRTAMIARIADSMMKQHHFGEIEIKLDQISSTLDKANRS